MLTRRTNLLLNEIDYLILNQLAIKKGETIGELIRQAIRKTYLLKKKDVSTAGILKQIDKLAKKANTENINYKELVNRGRRY